CDTYILGIATGYETDTLPNLSFVHPAPVRLIEVSCFLPGTSKQPQGFREHTLICSQRIGHFCKRHIHYLLRSVLFYLLQRGYAYVRPSPFRHVCTGFYKSIQQYFDVPPMQDIIIVAKDDVRPICSIKAGILCDRDSTVLLMNRGYPMIFPRELLTQLTG
ncbi:MAG: hypothetical protein L0L01_02620, partial [Bifidobacterium crudilactis]|nr:hypothetical protein [Bifidobacterium crudilactis]